MECDISADFDGTAAPFRSGDPKDVSFCVLGVTKEACGFTARVEFRKGG
jgi:hypothetical protein